MNNFSTNNCCNPNPCCDPCAMPVTNRSSGFAFVLVLFILLAIVGAAWF